MTQQTLREIGTSTNVQQAVPFFLVSNIEESVRYYVEGLGFEMTKQWTPNGKLQWCWLQHGGAALMLQEYRKDKVFAGKLGEGVAVCFQCLDALAIYRDVTSRGIKPKRPFVGNAMWVVSLTDTDGYNIDFESPTDAPEESEYTDVGS